MRYYISVDIEGVAGVFTWEASSKGHPKFAEACRLMTAEVNAAAEGIIAADPGAEIVVSDSHAMGENLNPEELNERIELIAGFPRPDAMMTGIDGGFDLALFVGYHARVGTELSTMDHSYSSSSVYRVAVNGEEWGETAINAAYAGVHKVPVGFVSGDAALREELSIFPTAPLFVETKKSLARFSSQSVHPSVARRRLKDGAEQMVRRAAEFSALELSGPITMEVGLTFTQKADMAAMIPGAERTGGRTIKFEHSDYREVFKFLMTLLCVAISAK